MATILMMDDDVQLQRVTRRIAEKAGHVFMQAFDGQSGLALVASASIDLIILDMEMPMDGRDVLLQLKRDPATAAIPVIIFSARDDQIWRRQGYDLGADDYVGKPFAAELLIRKIEHLIENRQPNPEQRTWPL